GALSETDTGPDTGHRPSRPRHARSGAGSAAYTAVRLGHATLVPPTPQKSRSAALAPSSPGGGAGRARRRRAPPGTSTVAANPRSAIIFLSPPALSMPVGGDLLRRKLAPTIFAARHERTEGKGSQ